MTTGLTEDQALVFEAIKAFFGDEDNPAIVVAGSAGTGKTYLTKHIIGHAVDKLKKSVVAVAPTHKARRVLSKKLNEGRLFDVPSLTVASILGKMREHTYIGSHKYSNGSKQKMDQYDCFILDEVSMVPDKDLDEIIEYICNNDRKLILIGDNCQIPAPNQELVKESGICYKPDSSAFEIENIHEMRGIVRQAAESPIIKIATYIRDNLLEDSALMDVLHGCGVPASKVCIEYGELYGLVAEDINMGVDARVIAYTNAAVHSHNEQIRKHLGYHSHLTQGELLTGYDNVGWPVPLIENGTDYRVTSLRFTNRHQIDRFHGLVGHLVDIVDVDDPSHVSRDLFFIDVQHEANLRFMMELVYRAEKVNQRYSKKNDYKEYCALKNRAVFLEDVYKYANKVVTDTTLKQLHPLLFTKVGEVIDTKCKAVAVSELTGKLEEQYGDIIEGRLVDNKPFADGEVFADQYMVVEKDISYGYAVTAHKSQGSTYENSYVDENDFKKISNKWNYRLHAEENRCKERNQLKYVAYTRASKNLRIVV